MQLRQFPKQPDGQAQECLGLYCQSSCLECIQGCLLLQLRMELPVIQSHLMGSTGLYGAPIGAPGIPLAMGIQISQQNGVHILKKPPIPPIHAVKGSANPIVQANNARRRRKIFPELQAEMNMMTGMMPQSLIGNQVPLPAVMGTTAIPPVPMVSQMGMPMAPPMNPTGSIMPPMLPTNSMMMSGMPLGMGTAPPVPQPNTALNLSAALGLGLLGSSQRGSFPQEPPMMMHDSHIPFDKGFHQGSNQFDNFGSGGSGLRGSQFRSSPMGDQNMHASMANFAEQLIHGSQPFGQPPPQYPPPPQQQQPIIINQPPQQPPVVIIQQPPTAPAPVVNQSGSLIDKVGLITGMVMAQKNSGRSQEIQNMEIAQLNEIKQQHDMNKTMMEDIKQERTFLEQDRTRFLQSQILNPTVGQSQIRQSTTFLPEYTQPPMNLDLSRISVGTVEEDIRLVIFPKCRPQIFSSKNTVL